MTRVLVTGFEAFGPHTVNPSGELARIADRWPDTTGVVLPVAYGRVASMLSQILAESVPTVWIGLGLCASASGLRLERFARNRDDSPQPDNTGVVRQGHAVVPSGPAAYPSTLPLSALAEQLRGRVPIEWSDDAGGYLCNHVFYLARHLTSSPGGPTRACGFLHLPPYAILDRDTQIDALRACVDLVEPH